MAGPTRPPKKSKPKSKPKAKPVDDRNTRDWGADGHRSAQILNKNTRKLLEQVDF